MTAKYKRLRDLETDMLKDIAKSFKLLKYGIQAKMLLWFSAIFFFLAIAMELLSFTDTDSVGNNLSGFYAVLIGLYFFQNIFTTSVSSLIQTSPYKYKIQVYLASVMCFIITVVGFSIIAVIKYFKYCTIENSEEASAFVTNLLFLGIVGCFIQMYNAFAYKHYVFGIILLIVGCVPFVFFGMMDSEISFLPVFDIPFAAAVAIDIAAFVIGAVLTCLFNKLFYKDDISKSMYKSALARAAK